MEPLNESPVELLQYWLQEAIETGVAEPGVMILATSNATGYPDQRAVLLKHIDAEGLVFFADYASKKAQDIEVNPNVCVHFYWSSLDRQVRVAGAARKISAAETTQILIGQPGQRVGITASENASARSRQFLMQQFNAMKARFYSGGKNPSRWGGYRIEPERFEFWRGGGVSIRERTEYRRDDYGNWFNQQLKP